MATYWPEFAQNGKDQILVRHLLSHTSGVSGWDQPITVEDVYDHEAAVARLAAQAPWWEPGTASGYHALNQGHLVGEVIRRADGRTLGTYFREELAEPLGADFHIGLAPEHDARVSNVVPPEPLELPLDQLPPDHPAIKTFTGPVASAEASWTEAWRRAEIGAANGHGNARSVARVQSVVSCGGTLEGTTFLSPATVDRIFDVQSDGDDLVLFMPFRFGIGYGLAAGALPFVPETGRICFWGGWGGSMVINDLDRRMTVTFMMNKMHAGILGNLSSALVIEHVYSVVD